MFVEKYLKLERAVVKGKVSGELEVGLENPLKSAEKSQWVNIYFRQNRMPIPGPICLVMNDGHSAKTVPQNTKEFCLEMKKSPP